MRCLNCGYENSEEAKFCGQCGEKLVVEEKTSQMGRTFSKRRLGILISAITVVLAILIAAAIVSREQLEKQRFRDAVEQADKYMDEMDYENAEASYLLAIEIEPKKKKPYLQLAEVYLAQEEKEKAKSILKKALEAGAGDSSADYDGQESEGDLEITDKLDEIENSIDYVWIVPNEIEADDIYYVRETDEYVNSYNTTVLQSMNSYAVIMRGDKKGLIDMSGNIIVDVEYLNVREFSDRYLFVSPETKYDPMLKMESDTYTLEGDTLQVLEGIGGGGPSNGYYYCGGIQNIMAEELDSQYLSDWDYHAEPTISVPVQESDRIFKGEDLIYVYSDNAEEVKDPLLLWLENEDNMYGIYSKEKPKPDFIYDECGSLSEGLFAVKRDGKWGYVNEKDEVIIPIEYDASWQHFSKLSDYHTISDKETEQREYCYSATEGYVVLCKENKWELRTCDGNVAIPQGVFEKICPVFEGKCWVKKAGKWGVIELKEEGTDNALRTPALSESELLEIMRQKTGYELEDSVYVDMDHDGAKEVLGVFVADGRYQTWYCSSDGRSCSLVCQNDDVMDACFLQLLELDTETHVAVNAYRMLGTGKNFSILALENGLINRKITNEYGTVSVSDEGDILLTVEAYNGYYDSSMEMYMGHTWNSTYLFYDGKQYKEYGASQISEEDFLKYENAEELLAKMDSELRQSDTVSIEHSYYRRKNGIIHIQSNLHSDSGSIQFGYYTVRYDGNSVSQEVGDYIAGQMGTSFSNLPVVF